MKIVISDYPDSMMPTHDEEKAILEKGLSQCEVVVYPYHDEKRNEFYQVIQDADAILTAFTKIDEEAMDHAPNLKVISINATGYDNVDLAAANKRGIGVCPVGEYATIDVAEYTISMILALVKNFKPYFQDIDLHHNWRYDAVAPNKRIEEMTLGIFGLGKIGKAVASRSKALGMKVIAYDPYLSAEEGADYGVEMVNPETIFSTADVITNHANLNESNQGYFNLEKFKKMQQKPYFINMGRGASVVESDLVLALKNHYLKGAGLDVLADETPDLAHHPLVGLPNVIITPHAAFYSATALKKLQQISAENIVYYLTGERDKVFKLVNGRD
ncbi:NAD(P)-dependent oxidoreductase [Isobaculum melis]|uniref:D-3-phosphoglycerate dehydrogenase n=1 Tax=Isobaculum melis TaxID=142588 RepID=A0A1H9TDJ4_9LACT|nr:NAD(P)-dependent oxidoreductase [Isobaculum melis]SER94889.1 D-3-phosphoglycerate dehydrogenase [Isobaculum melis]